MNTIIFSGSTIQSWIFAIFLCVVAPLCFLWYFKKKTGAKVSSFLAGIAFSLLFSFIGGVFLNIIVLRIFGLGFFLASADHPVYAALYGAASAGLMAFVGSYVGLKYAMKNRQGQDNAFLFGLGKGGFECFMNGATIYITNLIAAIFINSLGSEEYFKKLSLGAEELAQARSSFTELAAIPGYTYIIHATYLLLILCIHVATTLMIFQCALSKQSQPSDTSKKAEYTYYIPLAFVLQILGYVPFYLTNIPALQNSLILLSIDFVYTFAVALLGYRLYHRMKG